MVALGSEKAALSQADESHHLTKHPDSFPLLVSPSRWTTATVLSPSRGAFVSTSEKVSLSFSFPLDTVETFYAGSGAGI